VNSELTAVLLVMGELSGRDGQLLARRAGVDLPCAEIGCELGISENTATVATHRPSQVTSGRTP